MLFNSFGGGWVLLLCMGLYIDVAERTQNGFYVTSPPSHPILHLAAYLTIVISLQFVSAWLLMPAARQQSATAYWRRYTVTLTVCVLACVASAAFTLFGLLLLCTGCL